MSRTFCNDDDIITGCGFISADNGVQTSDLIDQISNIDYRVCNKMGTSIPNIFARMFLFSSAYNDITSLENKLVNNQLIYKGKAHDKSINPTTQIEYSSVYHSLISEHLDMLEFLFYYGHEVTFESWKLNKLLNCFRADDIEYDEEVKKLSKFADAIRAAIVNDTPVLGRNDDMEIMLIKYEGVLVGGTSPSLIVFTSPNWKREIENNNWDFTNNLFSNGAPRPLHKRSLPFRQLLTLLAEGGKLSHRDLNNFCSYVRENRENGYDNVIKRWWLDLKNSHGTSPISQWIDSEISNIADPIVWRDANEVSRDLQSPMTAISIYKQSSTHQFSTQYKIRPGRPDAECLKENYNGKNVTLKGHPMLIVEGGINGARYYENEYWKDSYSVPCYSQLKAQHLCIREVPGMNNLKYPILTVDDLLEENIAELPYIVNNGRFFTACEENFNFMLPIKRMYFRFFTFSDLQKNLTIKYTRDSDQNIISVDVNLVIPMPNVPGGKYTIVRNYSYADSARFRIINCRQTNLFNIGIFPFFKQKTGASYRFMMGVEKSNEIKCRLCNFDKAGFELPANKLNEGSELDFKLRSERSEYKTYFASHDENFDFIEFEIKNNNNSLTGIFIPLMKSIQGGTDNKWAYSVDFGTSNTHIVMWDTQSGGHIENARKFEYDDTSSQMVTLGIERNNRFQRFDSDLKREFVPAVFGKEFATFPIRSVLYEKEMHSTNMELFTERNIGFNFSNEIAAEFKGNKYINDLKWDIGQHAAFQCRIKAYCYQLLWMIRNHSISNGGTKKFNIAVTYPISMHPAKLRIIKEAWNNAWNKLIDANSRFPEQNFKSESIAPYKYTMCNRNDINRTDAYLNVDIGGGSTDFLYYKDSANRPTTSRAYSIFFAANDLWGNGIDPNKQDNKTNGFIDNLMSTLKKEGRDAECIRLEKYKEIASNSAGVLEFIFSHPNEFNFNENIIQSQIVSVVVMHFAAIIYYIARIVKLEKLSAPKYINFTGMGSKYINIITSSDSELAELIKVIFKLTGVEVETITVNREENPKEVTALGALYMLNPNSTNVQLPQSKVVYCIDGEEELDDALTYNNVLNGNLSEKFMNNTMTEVGKFMEILSANEFKNNIGNLGISYSYETLVQNGLKRDTLESSYMTALDKVRKENCDYPDSNLMDAPFFWALKDTLYIIANNIK